MTDWQERVILEKSELDTRLEKLNHFLNSSIGKSLRGKEQQLLEHQRYLMGELSVCLGRRIALFPPG